MRGIMNGILALNPKNIFYFYARRFDHQKTLLNIILRVILMSFPKKVIDEKREEVT